MFRIVDRSGAAIAASAAVVCLATLSWVVAGGSAARGDRQPGGYSVVGGADPSGSASTGPASSAGPVALGPDASAAASIGGADPYAPQSGGYGPLLPTMQATGQVTPGPTAPEGSVAGSATPGSVSSSPVAAASSAQPTPHASPSGSADPTPPARGPVGWSPEQLTVGPPQNAPGDQAWCEEVTVTFTNGGAAPVTSGQATLLTEVVDDSDQVADSYDTTVDVPVPIAPGADATDTYDVCLSPWQVPSGTHLETTEVTLVA
jgi:hypothetical protein